MSQLKGNSRSCHVNRVREDPYVKEFSERCPAVGKPVVRIRNPDLADTYASEFIGSDALTYETAFHLPLPPQ